LDEVFKQEVVQCAFPCSTTGLNTDMPPPTHTHTHSLSPSLRNAMPQMQSIEAQIKSKPAGSQEGGWVALHMKEGRRYYYNKAKNVTK